MNNIPCKQCGMLITPITANINNGVCMTCSRRKGSFERNKYSGLWSPINTDGLPFCYEMAGTEATWDPKAEVLSAFVIAKGRKYVDWGIRFLADYLNVEKLGVNQAELWSAHFLDGDVSFQMIYELPGDDYGLWLVEFNQNVSEKEPYWPSSIMRRKR